MIARPRNSLAFQGGFGVGKTVADTCEVRLELPELTTGGAGGLLPALVPVGPTVGPTVPWCHTSVVAKRATGLASYTIPDRSHGQRHIPERARNAAQCQLLGDQCGCECRRARTAPCRKRTLRKRAAARTGHAVWRSGQSDRLQGGEGLALRTPRSTLGADIYNLTNSNAVLLYNQIFNPNVPSGPGGWLQPQGILLPRFFRLAAQIDSDRERPVDSQLVFGSTSVSLFERTRSSHARLTKPSGRGARLASELP